MEIQPLEKHVQLAETEEKLLESQLWQKCQKHLQPIAEKEESMKTQWEKKRTLGDEAVKDEKEIDVEEPPQEEVKLIDKPACLFGRGRDWRSYDNAW